MSVNAIVITVLVCVVVLVVIGLAIWLIYHRKRTRETIFGGGSRTNIGDNANVSTELNDIVSVMTRCAYGPPEDPGEFQRVHVETYKPSREMLNNYTAIRKLYEDFLNKFANDPCKGAYQGRYHVYINVIEAIAAEYMINRKSVQYVKFLGNGTFSFAFKINIPGDGDWVLKVSRDRAKQNWSASWVESRDGHNMFYEQTASTLKRFLQTVKRDNAKYVPQFHSSSLLIPHQLQEYSFYSNWSIVSLCNPLKFKDVYKRGAVGKYMMGLVNIANYLRSVHFAYYDWKVENIGLNDNGEYILLDYDVEDERSARIITAHGGFYRYVDTNGKRHIQTPSDLMFYIIVRDIYCVMRSGGSEKRYYIEVHSNKNEKDPYKVLDFLLDAKCKQYLTDESLELLRKYRNDKNIFAWVDF